MGRVATKIPKGQPSDQITLGAITKFIPPDQIRSVLERTGKTSVRRHILPEHVTTYLIIAMAVYM